MWCEMGSCISWHADRAALGEADTRARAIDAGWASTPLAWLACRGASRPTPGSGPPPGRAGDRYMAIARAARVAAVAGDVTADSGAWVWQP